MNRYLDRRLERAVAEPSCKEASVLSRMGQPQHHHPVLRIGVDSGGDPATTRREEAPGPTSTRREEARRPARGMGTQPARARRGSASSAWTTLATIQQQPGGRNRAGSAGVGAWERGRRSHAGARPARGLGLAAGADVRWLSLIHVDFGGDSTATRRKETLGPAARGGGDEIGRGASIESIA